ncbi:MAG TPA: hypothetical protein ENI33_00800 [Thermoplasmatales archaeon]|nr:hypothetical protein [Thermoplasmatales archaeon]
MTRTFANVELNTLLLPLGIIPAIFLLYILIGGYEGKFQERYIFIIFIAGIFLGGIIYLIEGMVMYPIISEENIYLDTILFFSFIFSFLEQTVKLAILNLKKFYDEGLPLYGASFGMGFSSSFATLIFGVNLNISMENLALIIIPISSIFINCSLGILIGTGVKRNSRKKYFFISMLVGMILWISLIISISYSLTNRIVSSITSLFAFIFSFLFLYIVYKEHLPYAMKSRRELRKSYKNL